MKSLNFGLLITLLLIAALPVAFQSQTVDSRAGIAGQSPSALPPVEIISFKIGTDYYPMLDRKDPVATADSSDFPRTETERMQRRRRSEEASARGKLRSRVVIVDEAQWIKMNIKNRSPKAVRVIEWDFAFPRYENGQLVLRYEVVTNIEIKPGGKKTLKQPLPPGAKACEIVTVNAESDSSDKGQAFEAVCGPGFHDPSQLKLKQETVSIKRIEYADGSTWQRNH